jgi:hypothetical protein
VGETLKRVKNVAGDQSENSHHQDGFELFVVWGRAAEVMTRGLLGVVLDCEFLAHGIGRDVLAAVVAEFTLVYLAVTRTIGEVHLVMSQDTPQVIVIADPLAGFHGCIRGCPGTMLCQFPKNIRHFDSLSTGESFSYGGWPKDNLMQYVTFGGCCKYEKCVLFSHFGYFSGVTRGTPLRLRVTEQRVEC